VLVAATVEKMAEEAGAKVEIQPALSPYGRSIACISTRSSRTGLIPLSTHGLEYRAFGGDLWITAAVGGSARRPRVG
jgi:hypothetical protein